MKKIISAVSFIGLSTVLTGCDTGVAQAVDVTTEIETIESTIIEKLNTIASQEATLQSEFETTLAEDEDLSTLKDGSATVFENIKTRQTDLDSLTEAAESLKEQSDQLTALDSEELPSEEISTVTDDLTTLNGSLEQFIEQYGTSLAEQETYFQALVEEDATYETLQSGIEQLNEQHTATNDLFIQLDSNLAQLQASRTEAAAALESLEN
ncbi:YkyA family protein [Desemzia sp. RIT804]|uniref:YkyA family protein n=1 Tax=Desemzia sp. RIT 804 TaxID=2810209 RepID=UPI001951D64E|nr:YkyA family protein [Desemzia sp. RIT 804]MBM6613803.1 YkyA family protein [Desemzia sp. RIT 804]